MCEKVVFIFLCLTFHLIVSSSIHVVLNGRISFFIMTEWYSIVYMYHFFKIHSSVDAVMLFPFLNYCAAISLGVQMSLQHTDFIFFGQISSSGWMTHMVVLFLIVWGTSILFPIMANLHSECKTRIVVTRHWAV
jgi:hypothetical protein